MIQMEDGLSSASIIIVRTKVNPCDEQKRRGDYRLPLTFRIPTGTSAIIGQGLILSRHKNRLNNGYIIYP